MKKTYLTLSIALLGLASFTSAQAANIKFEQAYEKKPQQIKIQLSESEQAFYEEFHKLIAKKRLVKKAKKHAEKIHHEEKHQQPMIRTPHQQTHAVPQPSSLLLMGLGFLGLATLRKLKKSNNTFQA